MGGSLSADGTQLVHGLANDVHDPSQYFAAHEHGNGTGVLHCLTAGEAIGGVHRDAANGVLTEVLGDLDNQVVFLVVDEGVGQGEGREDVGELSGGKLHIDDGTCDLYDLASVVRHVCVLL